MHVNIVFAGGGVKGACLAGCLLAAENKGIQPSGFGGTSAGSIVATLAAVGYTGAELESILINTELTVFLDDGGARLSKLAKIWEKLLARMESRSYLTAISLSKFSKQFRNDDGLYIGTKLFEFLVEKISSKLEISADDAINLTFDSLKVKGGKPLRIVATDILKRRAVIFGAGKRGGDSSIVTAVCASAGFPFVFRPTPVNEMLLVDGGLSSNLPAFLFHEEYIESRTPTLAFDLLPAPIIRTAGKLGLNVLIRSLGYSALEASDVLLRHSALGVSYFPIKSPDGVGTLDFWIDRKDRELCFSSGYAQAAQQLEEYEPIKRAKQFGEALQNRLISTNGPPRDYDPVFRAVADQINLACSGDLVGIRVHIMLLTGRASETAPGTRMVTYSMGMAGDADRDLEIDQNAGCSGKAWSSGEVTVADLTIAAKNPEEWKMTKSQHNKVPERIKSMLSAPIFGTNRGLGQFPRAIGTLSVDCETELANTGWCTDDPNQPPNSVVTGDIVTVLDGWAAVVGRMLP